MECKSLPYIIFHMLSDDLFNRLTKKPHFQTKLNISFTEFPNNG